MSAIRQATPSVHTHVTPEEEKIPYTGTRLDIPSTQKYNTQSRTQIINYVATFNNTPTSFPMELTIKTKLFRGTEYYIHIYPQKYATSLEPM